MSELIDRIVMTEWNMFQKVQNEGGRASCQDDWETFEIMRESQFSQWSEKLVESYAKDLIQAKQDGRNLIFEKYGRMMKSTVPKQYEAELAAVLPELSDERIRYTESIIAIEVKWMEAFRIAYPKLGMQARVIHTSEDTPYDTSSETYLRGEMATYSDETLRLYGEYVQALLAEGKNLIQMTNEHMVKRYGYDSLEVAEKSAL